MAAESFLAQSAIYLTAAVAAVPLAKKLGLGSVLGYLLAGIVIGPWGLSFISSSEDILHFAEFGVVLLLFLIGLELNPQRLWEMRRPILGMGASQLLGTVLLVVIAGFLLDYSGTQSAVIGMALALSSTAIVLQLLQEKNLLKTSAGQGSFSILLFQDIAVIPILALIPLLGGSEEQAGMDVWTILKALAAIAGIVLGGRFLIRPVFRFIASSGAREIFTAFSLLLIIGIALLMDAVGLSMALGSFLAGVLMAESEYRHELEIDIEPFKGLLLGLFFIAVGMSIDFAILLEDPLRVLLFVLGVVALKMACLWLVSIVFKVASAQRRFFVFVLSQGGEFGFVVFSFAVQQQALEKSIGDFFVLVVALSMMTTPLLLILDQWLRRRAKQYDEKGKADDIDDNENPVVIAGFGRYGQIVGRMLASVGVKATVVDHDPDQIELLRKFGFKVYFGDSTRLDLLHAAGIEKAKIFICAIDDPARVDETIKLIKQHFPHVKVLVRVRNRTQAYEMMDLDVDYFSRETFYSAVDLGEHALQYLGYRPYQAWRVAQKFAKHDVKSLYDLYPAHKDEQQLIGLAKQARLDLEQLMRAERETNDDEKAAWE